MYKADYLIEVRKRKWQENHDIEYDKEFREALADEIVRSVELRGEIISYPEKLIELLFVVVDKNQVTMPFFLNEVQKDFIGKLNKAKEEFMLGKITSISMLILKGRQQGFTTLITAYQMASSITQKNFQGFTLADKSDNAETIFQNKAKYTYNQLPDILKPSEKLNNRKQLLFDKINSSWSVDTATKDVGRSRTINFFHGSECAFWKDGVAPIQSALGEAFTKNCIKIYESTANGYNDYQKMWESGAHINCFYEWWTTKEYKLSIPNEELKEEFLNNIEKKDSWIYERLRWLRNNKGLSIEQLYWYFKKYEVYIDKRLIRQEYPCTPEEAFLLSGNTVFDTEKLLARRTVLNKPIKVGYFIYDYDGMRLNNIRWVNDRNGYIKIYELPNTPKMSKYCIGGDTAGEGSDYFVGQVINAKTGTQCATLRRQFDPGEYVKQMYCLGKYYCDALIGIEANFDNYPIMELQRLGYYNQYVREKMDEYTGKTEKRFGFRTTSLTRPTIISNLIEIVREETDKLNDEDTIDELLTIIKNEKGKIEAPEGRHDDLMMALAIGYHIKEQVIFNNEPIYSEPIYSFEFERKEEEYSEIGEDIEII